MFRKGNKLYSIFNSKCPQCHEGDFFKNPLSFNILKTTETHSHCPHCQLKYMREPSFFYGAMYVGYGLSVALSIAIYIISNVFLAFSILPTLIFISVGLFVMAPLTLRWSRTIWINLFIRFRKNPNDRIL